VYIVVLEKCWRRRGVIRFLLVIKVGVQRAQCKKRLDEEPEE